MDEVLGQTIEELVSETEALVPIITFNQDLDGILGGGIALQKVTELFGESGVGKTTLCCQLALDVQIPVSLGGFESECLFIDTENTFLKERVRRMAEECASHCRNIEPSSHLTTESLLNGIHLIRCGTVDELREIIHDVEDYIRVHSKVKLIVIDSLAFPFYTGTEKFSERGKVLYEIFEKLFRVAVNQSVAIVVTNNMTTRFTVEGRFEYTIPFLGQIWTHIPNVRLLLEFNGKIRKAKLEKGTPQGRKTAVFKITSAGIR
jgi:RAD51-like protein 2